MLPITIIGIICQIFLYSLFGVVIYNILNLLRKLYLQKSSWATKRIPNNGLAFVFSPEEPLNLVLLSGVLFFEIIMLTIKVGFHFKGEDGDIPGLFLTFVPLGLIIYVGLENLIKNGNGVKKKESLESLEPQKAPSLQVKKKVDLKRKSWHFVGFALIFGILWIGYFVVQARYSNNPNLGSNEELYLNYWQFTEGNDYLDFMFQRHSLPMGQTLTVFVLYTATVIFVSLDLTRLSKNTHFFLQKNAQKHIHYKEMNTIAAYTHFVVAYFAAAIFLPPMLFMGALCLGTFADPAASIVGMNWGKKKFKRNDKTLEGTIAGSILAFISMIWFVGPIYATVGTIVFILVDYITPRPIKLSDNLVMPLVITVCFILLSVFGVQSVNFFGI